VPLTFPDPAREATHEAITHPRIGDRYTEMFAFWLYVIDVTGTHVTTLEANGPCVLPEDGTLRVQTRTEFAKRLSYGTIPDYWVRLVDRDNNVTGWLESARAESDAS